MDNLDISIEALKKCFDSERMSFLIEKFSQIGRDEYGGVTRLAFSKEDLKAREEFIRILESDLHVTIRTDTLGNIFARREGRQPDLPIIMTGSHLDSVRNGGKFDGPAGILSSFEAFRVMDYLGIETEHPYEIVVFTSEEPNTFGISTLGSRGVTGNLRKSDLEGLRDDQGNDLPGSLSFIGGDFNRIGDAVFKPGAVEYFVELHIEQMPYLEREKKDIGIVSGVTGIYRERIDVKGIASHCGTTPMDERSDALCAASEIILALEAAARKEKGKAVATVGHITVFPNSTNITPGLVEMDVEIRSYYPDSIQRIIAAVNSALSVLQKERKVKIDEKVLYETQPAAFSQVVREAIRDSANFLGLRTKDLISMAGHDAAHMNRICQSGMIFIPCKGGISHSPGEWTESENLVKGAECLLKTLLTLDNPLRLNVGVY